MSLDDASPSGSAGLPEQDVLRDTLGRTYFTILDSYPYWRFRKFIGTHAFLPISEEWLLHVPRRFPRGNTNNTVRLLYQAFMQLQDCNGDYMTFCCWEPHRTQLRRSTSVFQFNV